jgi:thiosulfate dehydrogenase
MVAMGRYSLGIILVIGLMVGFVLLIRLASMRFAGSEPPDNLSRREQKLQWKVPDPGKIPNDTEGGLVRYGRELIINTSKYLGPKGKVAAITNGMNCQNCHLDAGTRLFGNNYAAVFSTYPKYRDRSGSVETIYKRINDCLERSLGAKMTLDTNSREMVAIHAYMKWLGQYVPKGGRPEGTGIVNLLFPERAADPEKGEVLFLNNCQRCHGRNGEGQLKPDSSGYIYPPLWGEQSYTTAAGLFRLSRLAGYIRYNMPYDAGADVQKITDEEAWDIAAYVNSRPRPMKIFGEDWPDISKKPFDYPFGPFADPF